MFLLFKIFLCEFLHCIKILNSFFSIFYNFKLTFILRHKLWLDHYILINALLKEKFRFGWVKKILINRKNQVYKYSRKTWYFNSRIWSFRLSCDFIENFVQYLFTKKVRFIQKIIFYYYSFIFTQAKIREIKKFLKKSILLV